MKKLTNWCREYPGGAALVIILIGMVVVVFGVVGLVGMTKLNTANTGLWLAKHRIREIEQELSKKNAELQNTKEELQEEKTARKEAELARRMLKEAEEMTPEKVYKFTDMASITVTVGKDVPNVRPSPATASKVSFGHLEENFILNLEYLYAFPYRPDESVGSWIGIPLDLLSEDELSQFPEEVSEDHDRVVWISTDYLRFSDYLRNYSAEEVNLRVDLAVNSN